MNKSNNAALASMAPNPLMSLQSWNTNHVSEILGVKPVTVRTWRRLGCGPKFQRLTPRTVRYNPQEVLAWAAAQTKTSTSEA